MSSIYAQIVPFTIATRIYAWKRLPAKNPERKGQRQRRKAATQKTTKAREEANQTASQEAEEEKAQKANQEGQFQQRKRQRNELQGIKGRRCIQVVFTSLSPTLEALELFVATTVGGDVLSLKRCIFCVVSVYSYTYSVSDCTRRKLSFGVCRRQICLA